MPEYKFSCQTCGSTASEYFPIKDGPSPFPHEGCGTYERTWTVPATRTPYPAGWNYSVGAYVSSEREFNDALRRGAEEQSARVGMDHSYVPIDRDATAAGVDDTGMDQTRRERRRQGLDEPTRKVM